MTPARVGPERAAAAVLDRCRAAPAVLPGPAGPASGRLLCVDGRAGSGKTALAAALASRVEGSLRILHMDDLYEGWSGLDDLAERLRDAVVAPLAAGGLGRYRRWDWSADAWAEEHTVAPVDLLVLEGVGSGTPALDPWRSLLVWVDAPPALRRRRGIARDGPGLATAWPGWTASEDRVLARDRTRGRADVLVDGTGAREPLAR